jgi:hypothetical protein
MLIPAVVLLVVSFASSFLFDWFLKHAVTEVEPIADQAGAIGQPKGKTNRFKMLALLAVPLFIAQAASNAGRGSGPIAVASFLLVGYAVVCRLSFWKGLVALIAIAVAILFTAIQVLSISMGGDLRFVRSAMLLAGILATMIPVWLLVGRVDRAADRRPGWLSVVACLIVGGVAWVYTQYDPGTLLFGTPRFDFSIAKAVRNVSSHPNVDVKLSTWYGETQCEIKFKDNEGVDDFFETHPLPDVPMNLLIDSLPETVDMSHLEQRMIRNLQIRNSSVSSSQLVSFVKTQQANGFYLIGFSDCRFVPQDVEWPTKFKPSFGLGVGYGYGYGHQESGNLKTFFEAVRGLPELKLGVSRIDEEDSIAAVTQALKERGSRLELQCGASSLELAAAIAGVEGLSNVTLQSVQLEDADHNPIRSVLELVLNGDASIRAAPVQSDQLFWDLAFAAETNLVFADYSGNQNESREPEVPWDLNPKKIRDLHWAYGSNKAGEEITKLCVPYHNSGTTSELVNFPKLRSLSFDRSWLRAHCYLGVEDIEINLAPIKGVVELKELYMPIHGARRRLNLLAGQETLETFQFNASSLGFRQIRFPNLKHVILVVDVGTPDEDLLRELTALEHLERLTLVVSHQYMSQSFVADPKQLRKLFEGVLPGVNVEALKPYESYLPDDFLDHCERVRERCRQKYLK